MAEVAAPSSDLLVLDEGTGEWKPLGGPKLEKNETKDDWRDDQKSKLKSIISGRRGGENRERGDEKEAWQKPLSDNATMDDDPQPTTATLPEDDEIGVTWDPFQDADKKKDVTGWREEQNNKLKNIMTSRRKKEEDTTPDEGTDDHGGARANEDEERARRREKRRGRMEAKDAKSQRRARSTSGTRNICKDRRRKSSISPTRPNVARSSSNRSLPSLGSLGGLGSCSQLRGLDELEGSTKSGLTNRSRSTRGPRRSISGLRDEPSVRSRRSLNRSVSELGDQRPPILRSASNRSLHRGFSGLEDTGPTMQRQGSKRSIKRTMSGSSERGLTTNASQGLARRGSTRNLRSVGSAHARSSGLARMGSNRSLKSSASARSNTRTTANSRRVKKSLKAKPPDEQERLNQQAEVLRSMRSASKSSLKREAASNALQQHQEQQPGIKAENLRLLHRRLSSKSLKTSNDREDDRKSQRSGMRRTRSNEDDRKSQRSGIRRSRSNDRDTKEPNSKSNNKAPTPNIRRRHSSKSLLSNTLSTDARVPSTRRTSTTNLVSAEVVGDSVPLQCAIHDRISANELDESLSSISNGGSSTTSIP